MQTAITAFFKTKTPPAPKGQEAGQSDENNCDNAKDNSKHNSDRAGSHSQEAKTKKRPLDSDGDEDDDDDEGNIITSKNKKRPTLSSADSKPNTRQAKSPPRNKEDKLSVADGDTESRTPSKPPNMTYKLMAQQSPLFSIEPLVRKKIAAGAFALHDNIGPTWFKALQPEFDKPYFKKLSEFVKQQRQTKTVFPPPDQVFTWTHHHTISATRVVIIGQDPYHGPNQAHGLSFSVQKGIAVPKSLQNIYKELQNDIPNFKHPGHGNLTGWSKQGVLMLNACLTVNKGDANSHQGKGWETFTDAVISWISKNVKHSVVFLLWGKFAQKKSIIIDKRHKILTSAHPSPFSADSGFFGCKHFSQTTAHLRSQKLPEIDWTAL